MASDTTTFGTSAIGASANLKRGDIWEVTAALSIDPSGKGHHFLPAKLSGRRRRRISVEVHKVKSVFDSVAGAVENVYPLSETEICYVRILERRTPAIVDTVLDPIAHKLKGDAKKVTKGTVNFFTGSLRDKGDVDDISVGSDDESVMQSFREPSGADETVRDQPYEGWSAKYKIPLRMFSIAEKKKRSVIVEFKQKGRSATREYVFDSEETVDEFCTVIKKNIDRMNSRLKARVEGALGGIKLQKDEKLTLLFDICSGSDLPSTDIGKESDPYITVRFNGQKIHRTDYIPNERNPIWTLRKGSLFIWTVDALELFQAEEGLIFEVKDFDSVGSNESLGAFNINPRTLYNWKGERREFALKPLLGHRDMKKGKIALRVRRATDDDVDFMAKFDKRISINANALPGTALSPTVKAGTALKSIMTIHSKKEKEGPDKGKTKYLIRPGPDPKRKEETTWLTNEKIEEETLRPSYNWVDIGSGNLGKIFVEILSCDKLPNLDTGGVLGNKTDAFVSLVYEDCYAKTDIISDCLSPRWMPWTQRAFVFNMMHTSSQLFLAVFDSDVAPMSSHDLVGRVSIDVSNFQPNSIYLLHYNLFPTAKRGPREANFGTIRIRLRMELEEERTLLLSNFQMPLSVYVNTKNKKDFEVIQQTVEGGVDTRKYNIGTILSYNDELWSYLTIYYALSDAFISLLLWRGTSIITMPVPSLATRSMRWIKVLFPIHSLVAFISSISLVENPDLLPSFFFGAIGWLMLVTAERRSMNSNPWMRCKTFSQFLSALVLGKSIMGPHTIEANENVEGTENFWEKRVKEAEEKAKKRAEEYAREQEEYLKEMEEIGDTNDDLSAQTSGGLTVNPATLAMRAYLFPIQQYLRMACISLRVFKNIIMWEECYISFWIAMISFMLSVVFVFIPWGFLLKWTLRIVIWVAFGPWMKLVDIYFFKHLKEETEEQKKERLGKLQLQRQQRLEKQKLEARITREKAAKLRDFKQYMFGEYISRVNVLKKDRYYDLPLPASSATVYNPKSKTLGELAMQEAGYHRTRVEGQQLIGEMIPTLYETPTTEAPTGKPTKNIDLLEKGSPAALYEVNDSYSAAALKVGSIIVGAGAITWFGVPFVCYLVRLVLPK